MASIYDIDRALIECINEETGEIDAERFEELQMQRDEKIGGTARWILDLKGDILKLKEEEKRLADKRHVLENRVESLKRYLGYALNGVKFSTAKCSVSFRNTQSVDVTDAEATIAWARSNGHQECIKETAPTISKSELAKVLKDGVEVPGAQLVQSLSVGVK